MTHLNILFGADAHLKFKLRDISIAQRWANTLQAAIDQGYSIDDPERLYGFNSREDEAKKALRLINTNIFTINSYQHIIDRPLRSVDDQNTLNYLHHVFEVYHGLLDTQEQNEFFKNAPDEVRRALADLNVNVHRCESVSRGCQPRVVVTYYNMPKVNQFDVIDYLHFTNEYQFGTVYINYVEIGKTLDDLARDRDTYIADEAFRPFQHYSADFNIRFATVETDRAQRERQLIQDYYAANQDWFVSRGYSPGDYRLSIGMCPVAGLDTELTESQVLAQIRNNQQITRVWLS